MRDSKQTVNRRAALAGAGSAGALAAAAALLPAAPSSPSDSTGAQTGPAAEPATGYRLTEHIKRYYATARI